jgi:hypothetical protein
MVMVEWVSWSPDVIIVVIAFSHAVLGMRLVSSVSGWTANGRTLFLQEVMVINRRVSL